MRHIGPLATNNSLRMIFTLQQEIDFQHTWKINCKKKISIIDPFPTKNGATFCLPWRQKITWSELRLISKYLWPLRQRRPIFIAIYLQGCHIKISQGLVSYQTASIRVRKSPVIKVPSFYCVLYNKGGIPDHKDRLHCSENFFGKSSDQEYDKDGLWGSLGNRVAAVN